MRYACALPTVLNGPTHALRAPQYTVICYGRVVDIFKSTTDLYNKLHRVKCAERQAGLS